MLLEPTCLTGNFKWYLQLKRSICRGRGGQLNSTDDRDDFNRKVSTLSSVRTSQNNTETCSGPRIQSFLQHRPILIICLGQNHFDPNRYSQSIPKKHYLLKKPPIRLVTKLPIHLYFVITLFDGGGGVPTIQTSTIGFCAKANPHSKI